jgi:hypothetical protein
MKKLLLFGLFLILMKLNAQNLSLQWAKEAGSSNEENGTSVIDPSGNSYIVGEFVGTVDFDPGPAVFTLTCVGGKNVFILKLDASGNFVWAKQFLSTGGGSSLFGGIALDVANNLLVAGLFSRDVDFDPGVGTYTMTTLTNTSDIFVVKLDANGNFIWARQFGESVHSSEVLCAITTDASNNIFMTGYFQTVLNPTDFDPGSGVFNMSVPANNILDMYVMKWDAAGNFVWAKSIGGNNNDYGFGLAADAAGDLYITGRYLSQVVDFDPGAGNTSFATNGNCDIFILKLNASGNFVWAGSMGSTGFDDGRAIKVDGAGNLYVAGNFSGICDFDLGTSTYTLNPATGSGGNLYVTKLNAFTGSFIWVKQFAANSPNDVTSMELDNSGNIFLSGYFIQSGDFDPGPGTNVFNSAGGNDIFLLKLNSSGNMVWAKQIGGTLDDKGSSICVSSSGVIYCSGMFEGTCDFDPETPVVNLTSASTTNHDFYILKFNELATTTGLGVATLENMVLFPNPTNGNLNISLGNKVSVSFKLVNTAGQVVVSGEKQETTVLTVDLSKQKEGIYFLEISSDEGTVTRKVIKD